MITDQLHPAAPKGRREQALLALGALGVVYGDIGTSPLYAIRECFFGPHGTEASVSHVMGVLSLVFWALTLVVVVKYLTFVMRADNRGAGGIVALLALLIGDAKPNTPMSLRRKAITMLGLFGAALLFAEGMITPAISVLSAVEGLKVATTAFDDLVIPIAMVILVGLFLVQKHGTTTIARFFGPIMLIWFTTLAALGLPQIIQQPQVLAAVNPWYAISFILESPGEVLMLLGAVVLCITGAEALYADMGHFGRGPIRLAWYLVVFPALLLNYFGQGALILTRGEAAAQNPFYLMAPSWFLYPLVLIATVAAIIASQALISGAYSLAQQTMQLGYSPRLVIIHTSHKMAGQIYLPGVNLGLMVASIFLVMMFQTSSNLAAMYGLTVMGTMTCTTLLLGAVAVYRWKWGIPLAALMTLLFLAVDLPFLYGNLQKFSHGGWFPLTVAGMIVIAMTTWYRGRAVVSDLSYGPPSGLKLFLDDVRRTQPHRVEGTAVFMSSRPGIAPSAMLHHFKHNRVLHQRVILLTVVTHPVPKALPEERLEIRDLGQGFVQITAVYGFMEEPDVPEILRMCKPLGLDVDPNQASYYLGRMTLLTTGRSKMWRWRKSIFSFLFHNERPATAFFNLPPNRVVELGRQIEF